MAHEIPPEFLMTLRSLHAPPMSLNATKTVIERLKSISTAVAFVFHLNCLLLRFALQPFASFLHIFQLNGIAFGARVRRGRREGE